MRVKKYKHIFVDTIPATLQEKVIYVSIKHKTVAHLCACGCSQRIDTPLDPDEWRLTFDGEHISLWPSIGNWDLPCRSHYFITGDKAIPVRSRHKNSSCSDNMSLPHQRHQTCKIMGIGKDELQCDP